MSIPYNTRNFTVTSGQQTSNEAIDLGKGAVVGFLLPAVVTSTAMTILACDTATGTFLDVYSRDGTQYSITVAANRAVMIPPADLAGIRFIKIKMGSAEGQDIIVRCIERWV